MIAFFRRTALRKEIAVLLVLKLCALILIKHFFFGTDHKIPVTPDKMQQHLITAHEQTP